MSATRSTRLAANVAAAAVVVYAVLWLLSTQVDAVRALSPFAEDPWDAVVRLRPRRRNSGASRTARTSA
jgi:hypothetical protein